MEDHSRQTPPTHFHRCNFFCEETARTPTPSSYHSAAESDVNHPPVPKVVHRSPMGKSAAPGDLWTGENDEGVLVFVGSLFLLGRGRESDFLYESLFARLPLAGLRGGGRAKGTRGKWLVK